MRELWNTFGFTGEQRLMREPVLSLLARVLSPEKVRDLDRRGEFPFEAYDAMAQAGGWGYPSRSSSAGAAAARTRSRRTLSRS